MALREEFEAQGNFLFKYRGQIPILLFPLLIPAFIDSFRFQEFFGEKVSLIVEYSAIAISFLGLIVRFLIIGFVPSDTSGRNTDTQKAGTLNKTGIYSIVRHPLYLGNFLMFIGIILFLKVWWFFVIASLAFWIYYERIMYREEEFLRKKFGDEYLKWAEKTPAFFPKIRNWQSPSMKFSLKIVIRREYIGLFEMILLFYLLQSVYTYIETGSYLPSLEWRIFFLSGLGLFTIIRILAKGTKLLDIDRSSKTV